MTENEPSDDEPVFEVRHMTGDCTIVALDPQFGPGDLSDDQRQAYNTLKKSNDPPYTHAVAVPQWAVGKFDTDGETVTIEDASRRYAEVARETAETLKRGMCEFAETLRPALASVVESATESMQPLVEFAEEHELEDSDD